MYKQIQDEYIYTWFVWNCCQIPRVNCFFNVTWVLTGMSAKITLQNPVKTGSSKIVKKNFSHVQTNTRLWLWVYLYLICMELLPNSVSELFFQHGVRFGMSAKMILQNPVKIGSKKIVKKKCSHVQTNTRLWLWVYLYLICMEPLSNSASELFFQLDLGVQLNVIRSNTWIQTEMSKLKKFN